MPRRSSRLRAKKRVNYNEDAMFYRATKTKKSDWTEVEDTDPVPVYRPKPLFRKKLPKKKKAIQVPPPRKKKKKATRKKTAKKKTTKKKTAKKKSVKKKASTEVEKNEAP